MRYLESGRADCGKVSFITIWAPIHQGAPRAATALFVDGDGCADRLASLSVMPQMEVDGSHGRLVRRRIAREHMMNADV